MARSVHRALVVLFAVSIVALGALMAHWTVLLWQHEATSTSRAEQDLRLAAHEAASSLRRRPRPPVTGPLRGHSALEVVRLDSGRAIGGAVSLAPAFSHLGVRPRPAALDAMRARRRRRFFMILGEGSLALGLLMVFFVALFRLLQAERQRRREIEAFISTVSHELKTPLGGIKALLSTLQMGNIPAERMSDFLDMGLRESDRLEHLVENILIANRIRRSTLAVRLEELDLGLFLREYLEHRNALLPAGHPGVALEGASPDGVLVLAEGDKLRVVLENLTDNAIKYGGGSAVRLEVKPDGDRVMLAVEDDGVGFDPERAQDIFEGFRAAAGHDAADAAMVHGTGLGLGIARKLARAMGGDVTAASEGRGKGSRFVLWLRRAEVGA